MFTYKNIYLRKIYIIILIILNKEIIKTIIKIKKILYKYIIS